MSRQVYQNGHGACVNILRGTIAKVEAKKRPHDLQNQECSLQDHSIARYVTRLPL
jgi:hypothetical protein